MNIRKLLMAIAEAFMIYGLIIVGYGILAIHISKTWFEDCMLIGICLAYARSVYDD